jgi:hypothetical protein
MNDRFKFRIPMFTDKGTFMEFQYVELGDEIECSLCGYNGEPQQSTGLHDKTDKLIYEGDIVNVLCGNFIIKYCDNCKSFQCFYKDDCFACEGDYHWFELLDDLENLEVIGNIYKNSDLLEEKEQ